MKALIVHHDNTFTRQILEILEDDFLWEEDALHDAPSLYEASNLGDYDVVFLDLRTTAETVLRIPRDSADAIRLYLQPRPNTRIVLHHTVSHRTAEAVKEEVLEHLPNAKIDLLDCMASIDQIREAVTGKPVTN